MNIVEFREKYPQYDSIDDEKLSTALYEKYYSHVDKQEFMGKFLAVESPPDLPIDETPPQPEPVASEISPQPTQGEAQFNQPKPISTMGISHGSPFKPKSQNETVDISSMHPIGQMVSSFRSDTGDMSAGEVATKAVKNLPASSLEFGKAVAYPLVHPIETYKGMKNLISGLYSKATGGERADQETLDAVTAFYAERYGTAGDFKKTLSKDPVGVLADLSAFLTAVGGATKLSGMASGSQTTRKAGEAISKSGASVEPLNIVKKAVSPTAKVVKDKAIMELYGRGAKIQKGKRFTLADRDRAIKTALKEGVITKESSIAKVWEKISSNSDEIDAIIDSLAEGNTTISRNKLYAGLSDMRKKVHPQRIDRNKAITKLIVKLRKSLPEDIPVKDVQTLKRTIYKELENHYAGGTPKPPLIKEFNEIIARSSMKELEKLYPEIGTINKQTSDYIHLAKAIDQAAKRVSNKNIISFDTVMKMMLGQQVGDTTGLFAGLIVGVLDRDLVKQRLAIALHRIKKQGVTAKNATKKNITYGAGRTGQAEAGLLTNE